GPYGVEKDRFNHVEFAPVTTTAVRIEVEPVRRHYKSGEIGPPEAMFLNRDIDWREFGLIEGRGKEGRKQRAEGRTPDHIKCPGNRRLTMRFSRLTRPNLGAVLVVAGCAVLLATVAVRAQRGGGGGAGGGANIVPVAASSLVLHPEIYVGQQVSMLGTVQKSISKTTFTMGQGKTPMKQDVLVIAPNLQSAPDDNAYVTVVGDAIKFDP